MEGSRLSNKNNKKTQFLVHMQKGEFKNLCYTYLSGNCQWVCLCSGLYPYICTHVYVYMYLSLCPCVYVLLAKNSWHSCRTRPTLIASQRSQYKTPLLELVKKLAPCRDSWYYNTYIHTYSDYWRSNGNELQPVNCIAFPETKTNYEKFIR